MAKFLSVPIILASVFIFSSCQDVIFNNPLDPDASREALKLHRITQTTFSGKGDICFDGEKIWKINDLGQITSVDIESGTVIRQFSKEPGTGIAFSENQLALCSQQNFLIFRDPLSGTLLNQITTSDIYPSLLASADNLLYMFDQRSHSIFEFDPLTRKARRLFQLTGLNLSGMEYFQGDFLVTDINSDSVYRISFAGTISEVFRSPARGVAGICADDRGYIYILSIDGQLYKVSLP